MRRGEVGVLTTAGSALGAGAGEAEREADESEKRFCTFFEVLVNKLVADVPMLEAVVPMLSISEGPSASFSSDSERGGGASQSSILRADS